MLKYIVFVAITLCCTFFCSAQQTNKYKYNLYGPGSITHNLSFLSPLYYEGLTLNFTTGKDLEKKGGFSSSSFSTTLVSSGKDDKSINAMFLDLILSRTYHINLKEVPEDFPDFSLGWAYWLSGDIAAKTDNVNNPGYFTFNNLACFTVDISFDIFNARIINRVFVPLVGIYSGSEYGKMLPYFIDEHEGRFLEAFHVGSLNLNTEFLNRLSCDIPLKIKGKVNTFRLQWEVNMQLMKLNHNITHQVINNFKVGYLFNTRNYEHPKS